MFEFFVFTKILPVSRVSQNTKNIMVNLCTHSCSDLTLKVWHKALKIRIDTEFAISLPNILTEKKHTFVCSFIWVIYKLPSPQVRKKVTKCSPNWQCLWVVFHHHSVDLLRRFLQEQPTPALCANKCGCFLWRPASWLLVPGELPESGTLMKEVPVRWTTSLLEHALDNEINKIKKVRQFNDEISAKWLFLHQKKEV